MWRTIGIIICVKAVDRRESSDRRADLSLCLSKIAIEIREEGESSRCTVIRWSARDRVVPSQCTSSFVQITEGSGAVCTCAAIDHEVLPLTTRCQKGTGAFTCKVHLFVHIHIDNRYSTAQTDAHLKCVYWLDLRQCAAGRMDIA